MSKAYEVIIIGGGPAGLTAALYCARGKMNTLLLEREIIGGQALKAHKVDNYPGFPLGRSGVELINKMHDQVASFDGKIWFSEVESLIKKTNGVFEVGLSNGETVTGTCVIIATGGEPRKLNIKGENDFLGKGVSYCATCDGNFFKNKVVAMVGGGNSAVQEAIYLSNIVKKIYIIHRRDEFRADRVLINAIEGLNNVEFILDSVVTSINGEKQVESINIYNNKKEEENNVSVNGVFIRVGMDPKNDFLPKEVELDRAGFIETNDELESSVKGIFVAGDVRKKAFRQIVTACGDGANAAYSAEKYLARVLHETML